MKLIPDSDPRLHQMCDPVQEDEVELLGDFIRDMFPFMYANNGMGLAAPQIGVTKRFFILGRGGVELACINPEVLEYQGPSVSGTEGCLSYPGQALPVSRVELIKVRYTTPEGKTKTHRLKGIMARAFLHELDHLDGIVFHERTGVPINMQAHASQLYALERFDPLTGAHTDVKTTRRS